ncbi:MAG: 4Fe-4S binding protein [Synergistaceae bacterium]|nr:4Fe-4S binding protein [Synergistaceae bacterium]
MLINDGVPTKEDLEKVFPSEERMAKGPVSVIECFQKIPCNPCVKACPRGAIDIGCDINNVPSLDDAKCNGCGICILRCPGLAIFVVDKSCSKEFAIVKIPFEYIPLPEKGQLACGLDREGKELGWFEVTQVISGGGTNMTHAIALKVPQELAMEVRNIKVGGYK